MFQSEGEGQGGEEEWAEPVAGQLFVINRKL